MKRYSKLILIIASFFILIIASFILLRGCKPQGRVSVICPDVAQFESEYGIINVGQKSLGMVLSIDTFTKRVFNSCNLKLPMSAIRTSTERDSIVMLSDTKFKVELSGEVASASSDVKAKISSVVENNTTFFLSNCIRKDFDNPIEELNAISDRIPELYRNPLIRNSHLIIAVVTSVTYADKFEFRLNKAVNVNSDVNIVDIDGYKLYINYECQNSLNIQGKQDGMFYKVTYYALYKEKFIFIPAVINLNEYKMSENALE